MELSRHCLWILGTSTYIIEEFGIKSLNLSTLEYSETRLFTKSQNSLDHESVTSKTSSRTSFNKSNVHLHDDTYNKLEDIKISSMERQGHNAS